MKKIMFNDKYGLTEAVLKGRKTMTRRAIPEREIEDYYGWLADVSNIGFNGISVEFQSFEDSMKNRARYEVGEVVAIAQAYKELYPNADFRMVGDEFMTESVGWNNKMFVRAELMPHHIKITDIKVERLQDISNEDCLKEGVWLDEELTRLSKKNGYGEMWRYSEKCSYGSARRAFEGLIDRISGNGTWARNPFVFAYEFELID